MRKAPRSPESGPAWVVLWSRGGEPGGPSWSPALPPASVLALPAPPGLYGHSAVYHEATDSLYVFGGFRFHVELAAPSPELYSLHCPDRTWSLLAPSQGAKVRKKGQTDESAGAGGGPPPFPVPQGVAQSRIPTPPPFQYSPPPGLPFCYLTWRSESTTRRSEAWVLTWCSSFWVWPRPAPPLPGSPSYETGS